MGEMLFWWLSVEVIGLAGLPLAALVFGRLPDRGWALTKPFSLVLLCWLIWFPLSLIGALPYSRVWILATLLLFAAGNAALLLRTPAIRWQLRQVARAQRGYLILAEALFAGSFALMGWLRSFTPGVVDTEKFMDVAFLSAIWRAPHLPPPDPWLSGYGINYYYFGHFVVATLAKLLGTVPAVAFNTGIALIFGLAAVSIFGVATNMVAAGRTLGSSLLKPALAGGVAAVSTLAMGNLQGALVWWQAATAAARDNPALGGNPWAWWFQRALWTGYDWWAPSGDRGRVITEFPAFSFTLADLHAHVLALPFAALAVGVAFALLLADGVGMRVLGGGWRGILALVAVAVALGGLYPMNGWDLPTYVGLAILALVIQQWLAHGRRLQTLLLLDLSTVVLVLVALAVIAYLPYYRGFSSPGQGIGLVPADGRSPVGDVVGMFGLPLFLVLSFAAVRLLTSRGGMLTWAVIGAGGALLPLTLALPRNPAWTLWWALLVLGACAMIAARMLGLNLFRRDGERHTTMKPGGPPDRGELWVWCLAGTAVALIGVSEVVFLRDIFSGGASGTLGPLFRMNTVFKLYFQAWLLLGIASGPLAYWLAARAASALRAARAAHHLPAKAAVTASTPAEGGEGTDAGLPPTSVVDMRRDAIGGGALRWLAPGGIVLWIAVSLALVGAATIYPVLATATRTQNFSAPRSLDGTAYMATDLYNAGDAPAIAWLNAHVEGDPVIVEAAKYDEYTRYGRISAFTGLPTIIGWGGHEVQWRVNWLAEPGRGDVIGQRLNAVNAIYTNPDANTVLALLRQYGARYVYVGAAERQLYPEADFERFGAYLKPVYQGDGVTIYEVP